MSTRSQTFPLTGPAGVAHRPRAVRNWLPRLACGALGLGTAGTALGQSTLSAPRSSTPAEVVSESPPVVRLSSVAIRTGVTLQYAEAGPIDGEPVLFLHGITDSWFSYHRVLERLPEGIRALVPSQRGHGDSDRPSCCYRMDDFATDAMAFLDALGVERATVVGHSMGSIIAQIVAATHPDRVARLVLIGSGTPEATSLLDLQESFVGLTDPVPHEFIEEFQYSTVYGPVPAAFMRRVVAESDKVPARVWRDALAGMRSAKTADLLPRLEAPTLIVWGERDAVFGREQQDILLGRIQRATLEIYPETGHAPHWEQPARFTRDLARFVHEGPSPAEAGDALESSSPAQPGHSSGIVPAEARRIPVGDGVELYFESRGSGRPLVLLHYFGASGAIWQSSFPELAETYRVIAIDLPGQGRSSRPVGRFRHRDVARYVLALLDTIGVDRFQAIGMSSGAMTVLQMAVREPSRVEAMILVGGTYTYTDEMRSLMRAPSCGSFFDTDRAFYRDLHPGGDVQIEAIRRDFCGLEADDEDMNLTDRDLSTVRARTLVVHGDRDELFPVRVAVEMFGSIPGSALWVIPNGSHLPVFGPRDQGRFLEAALGFLDPKIAPGL